MPFPNSAQDGTRVLVVFSSKFTIFTIAHFQILFLIIFSGDLLAFYAIIALAA
jgi:hypothetical protein